MTDCAVPARGDDLIIDLETAGTIYRESLERMVGGELQTEELFEG